MSEDEIIELHVVFHGRVQGVGFRYTARHYAKQLNLVGTVSNHPQGTVELYVVGSRLKVEQLLQSLQNEFHITNVISKEISPKHSYQDFQIV
jgi:acylphosphatase